MITGNQISKLGRIAGMAALATCPVFVIFGGVFFYVEWSFTQRAVETQGTVVKVVKERGSEGKTLYSFEYEYQDEAGKSHRAQPSVSTSPQQYFKGDTLPVLYDPEAPESSEIDTFIHLWLGPLLFSVVGIMNLGLGIFLMWVLPRLVGTTTKNAHES